MFFVILHWYCLGQNKILSFPRKLCSRISQPYVSNTNTHFKDSTERIIKLNKFRSYDYSYVILFWYHFVFSTYYECLYVEFWITLCSVCEHVGAKRLGLVYLPSSIGYLESKSSLLNGSFSPRFTHVFLNHTLHRSNTNTHFHDSMKRSIQLNSFSKPSVEVVLNESTIVFDGRMD